MSERPTPETDALDTGILYCVQMTDHARRMERQRDDFRAMWERDSKALGVAIGQRDNARAVAEDNRARYVTAEAQRDELAAALRELVDADLKHVEMAGRARALLARIEGGKG